MLEEYVDKAANGIKSGIGWVRDHKKKIIAGVVGAAGTVAGIAAVSVFHKNKDDDYLCLDESEVDVYEVDDVDVDLDNAEVTVEVSIEEKDC